MTASLPLRERGSKHIMAAEVLRDLPASLPLRERGLKHQWHAPKSSVCRRSLPLRERGLKPHVVAHVIVMLDVAPPAGAWIETRPLIQTARSIVGRSPCGSVD